MLPLQAQAACTLWSQRDARDACCLSLFSRAFLSMIRQGLLGVALRDLGRAPLGATGALREGGGCLLRSNEILLRMEQGSRVGGRELSLS